MIDPEGKLEPEVDCNGKRKAHPVRFTYGNWIAIVSLTLAVLIGSATWLDRYQTKKDAEIAVLEQKLVDQAQQHKIDDATAADTETQQLLATYGAVLSNVKKNVRRMIENQKNGKELEPVDLPLKVKADLEKLLAPTMDGTP